MATKVGLITIHDIPNYGSVLQAFATQRVVSGLGYDVQIIDYKYPNAHHVKGTKPQRARAAALRFGNAVLKDMLPGRPYTTYKNRYRQFKDKYYQISPTSYPTVASLMSNPPTYDVYLAGSDQIWRPEDTKADPCFFLDFAKHGRRVSYASSFGCINIPQQYRKIYSRYLNSFSHLGVREIPGQQIIKELTGREATVVLDPTLLMTLDQWQPYIEPFACDEPYIACYGLSLGSTYMEDLALHISKLTGYRIVRINGKCYNYFSRRMRYVLDAGPSEWMGILSGASLILGQSFHAVAFSIILQRPFFAILQDTPDHQSRQVHILKLLGLEDRAIRRNDTFPPCDGLNLAVDFRTANQRLIEQREQSLSYLKQALRGE